MTGLAVFLFIVIPLAAQAGVRPAVVVDGQYDEWDLDKDSSRPMHTVRTCKGVNGRKCIGERVPNVYLRYDNITNTVFVLVLQKDSMQDGKKKPVVNIYSLGQNIPVDPADINGVGKISNFSWVMAAGARVGWEGSFQLIPGTYDCDTALDTIKGTKAASERKKASEVEVLDIDGLLFDCD
ncbi:MAG: hypothetical protein D3922_09765 [Candidatus Electrothrix sp. AR1]|nr:hypothetical protein [Candidatus Electrothrix sp. AR1]